MDFRRGPEPGRQDGGQVTDDLTGPLTMDLVPGMSIVHRRTEMVAEWHWSFSLTRGGGK